MRFAFHAPSSTGMRQSMPERVRPSGASRGSVSRRARAALPESPARRMLRRLAARIAGAVLLGLVVLSALALITWSVDDPSWSHATNAPVTNMLGAVGAIAADLVMQLIGVTAALFLLPVAVWGWQLLLARLPRLTFGPILAWVAAIFTGATFMSALPVASSWPLPTGLGGATGDGVLHFLSLVMGDAPIASTRLVVMLVFGTLTLFLMVSAMGLPGQRVAGEAWPERESPSPAEEQEKGPGKLTAFLGALLHGWLMLRASLRRRRITFAYPGEEARNLDEDEAVSPPRAGFSRRREPLLDGAAPFVPDPDEEERPFSLDDRLADYSAEPLAEEGVRKRFSPAAFNPFARAAKPVPPPPPREESPLTDFPDSEAASKSLAEEHDQHEAPRAHPIPLRGPAARLGAGTAPAVSTQRTAPAASPTPAMPSMRKIGGTSARSAGQGWHMPPLTLLAEPKPGQAPKVSMDALEQNARLLEGVLDDFGVKGEIVNVHPGPVVTLYELEPAPGIKSSRVIGLADDIARSMSAISARVAVIPGKNAIGIELPNARRETVYLRTLIGSTDFDKAKSHLALALGKTIGGEPVIIDLARTPHMLVAGTTGSGKSVSINTMILSLLYRLKPEECRLIMIDPKMLELSVYDGIPHLLTPVVTDPRKAVVALKWTVREMEDRYKKMSKLGVRNIEGFNARLEQAIASGAPLSRTVQTGFDRETGEPVFETEEMDLKPLPFIVVIIDEMADLMMVAGKDIEGAVQRLAQMARAAGIHVIMATQRPSVDVITGTIKANFPTRVSFQVTSKIDSRTILGEQGAEQLLGQGDMLYMAGGGRIQRVHGPFVSDGEVEAVVAHLKAQGAPEYLDAITREDEEEEGGAGESWAGGGEGGEGADLYDQAVAIVLRDRKVSTSYIQRRLGIGYNRAASIIERMEKEGLVSQANHAGKREILIEGGEVD